MIAPVIYVSPMLTFISNQILTEWERAVVIIRPGSSIFEILVIGKFTSVFLLPVLAIKFKSSSAFRKQHRSIARMTRVD